MNLRKNHCILRISSFTKYIKRLSYYKPKVINLKRWEKQKYHILIFPIPIRCKACKKSKLSKYRHLLTNEIQLKTFSISRWPINWTSSISPLIYLPTIKRLELTISLMPCLNFDAFAISSPSEVVNLLLTRFLDLVPDVPVDHLVACRISQTSFVVVVLKYLFIKKLIRFNFLSFNYCLQKIIAFAYAKEHT